MYLNEIDSKLKTLVARVCDSNYLLTQEQLDVMERVIANAVVWMTLWEQPIPMSMKSRIRAFRRALGIIREQMDFAREVDHQVCPDGYGIPYLDRIEAKRIMRALGTLGLIPSDVLGRLPVYAVLEGVYEVDMPPAAYDEMSLQMAVDTLKTRRAS